MIRSLPRVALATFAICMSARLALTLDEEGAPEHIEVRETTLPEVVPRVLGIVGDWRFPESASRAGTLDLRVRTR